MRKQAAVRQADILNVRRLSGAPLTACPALEDHHRDAPEIAPPTEYRTPGDDRQGRVQKLDSLKAFVPRGCGNSKILPVLSIRDGCGHTTAVP